MMNELKTNTDITDVGKQSKRELDELFFSLQNQRLTRAVSSVAGPLSQRSGISGGVEGSVNGDESLKSEKKVDEWMKGVENTGFEFGTKGVQLKEEVIETGPKCIEEQPLPASNPGIGSTIRLEQPFPIDPIISSLPPLPPAPSGIPNPQSRNQLPTTGNFSFSKQQNKSLEGPPKLPNFATNNSVTNVSRNVYSDEFPLSFNSQGQSFESDQINKMAFKPNRQKWSQRPGGQLSTQSLQAFNTEKVQGKKIEGSSGDKSVSSTGTSGSDNKEALIQNEVTEVKELSVIKENPKEVSLPDTPA